jgi:chromosomal replication initiator protein
MPNLSITENLWNCVKDELRKLFPGDIFDTWFSSVVCDRAGEDFLILQAPTDFAAIWIEDNYLGLISEKASAVAGQNVTVSVESSNSANLNIEKVNDIAQSSRMSGTDISSNSRMTNSVSNSRISAPISGNTNNSAKRLNLNPKNTFDNFIVGPSNQLSHAASLAVAEAPGKAYNPLFLYGETGLGKTHLMHAIAHTIVRQNPSAKIVYVSCEKFTNEFMKAIRDNTLDKFRKFYRNVDALLIDDIQFLEGKERTQEEFFHTFNELFDGQKQLCLTSDRPASEISRLESRLVSRFQWGMVTDIQPPDFETRSAIISKKASALDYHISPEILQFLAQRITSNVRRMEGALIKVATYAKLIKQTLTLEIAEGLVQDILREEAQNKVTIEKIQKKVVEYYDLRMADMSSKRRPSNIAFPRQIAMYLCRILTSHPLKEIGEAFGGRDHGTVIHACKTVENLMDQDATIKRSVQFITSQLSKPV